MNIWRCKSSTLGKAAVTIVTKTAFLIMPRDKSCTSLCWYGLHPSAELASHSAHVLHPCPSRRWRKNNWGIFHWKDAVVKTKTRFGLFYFLLSEPTRSEGLWWLQGNDGDPPPSDLSPLRGKVLRLFQEPSRLGHKWTQRWTNAGFLPLLVCILPDFLFSNCPS